MATNKPRITITITQRQHDVFRSISASSGQPMSGFIQEVLAASMPVFEKMAVTFQHLKQAKDLERQKYVDALEEAHSVFEPLAVEAVDQFDLFMGKLDRLAAVPGARAARPGTRADGARDPRTNRGVTGGERKGAKPKGHKAKRAISSSPVSKKKVAVRQHKTGGAKP